MIEIIKFFIKYKYLKFYKNIKIEFTSLILIIERNNNIRYFKSIKIIKNNIFFISIMEYYKFLCTYKLFNLTPYKIENSLIRNHI